MIRTPFSASNFSRRLACPGSLEMEKDLPEVESEWSAEGQRLHHAAATGDMMGLTSEQVELVQEKLATRNRFLESIGIRLDDREVASMIEGEMIYRREGLELFRSHADLVVFKTPVLAVIDYKFGYEEVDAPDLNHQLAVYIASAAELVQTFDEYYGLIIPRFGKPAPPVKYTRAEIPALRKLIDETYDACTPTALRVPGLRQCKYCRAFQLGVCKEAVSLAVDPIRNSYLAGVSPEGVMAQMAPDMRRQLFDAFKMAADLRVTFTKAAKVLLEKDPEFVPGYRLSKEGEVRTRVTDLPALMDRLQKQSDLTLVDIASVCSISNKSLSDLIGTATNLKGRELKEKVSELTAGLTDTTPVERSLERE